MSFSFIKNIGHRQAFLFERLDHDLRLRRRYDLIFRSLEEDDGTIDLVCTEQGRALLVDLFVFGIFTDQSIRIS